MSDRRWRRPDENDIELAYERITPGEEKTIRRFKTVECLIWAALIALIILFFAVKMFLARLIFVEIFVIGLIGVILCRMQRSTARHVISEIDSGDFTVTGSGGYRVIRYKEGSDTRYIRCEEGK